MESGSNKIVGYLLSLSITILATLLIGNHYYGICCVVFLLNISQKKGEKTKVRQEERITAPMTKKGCHCTHISRVGKWRNAFNYSLCFQQLHVYQENEGQASSWQTTEQYAHSKFVIYNVVE